MSLRRIVCSFPILSRKHKCLRQCVRFRKPISETVTDRHLNPEITSGGTKMMNLISMQEGNHIYVTAYSHAGFELNKIKLKGPHVLFPRNCLKWNVKKPSDINEKSLGLFTMLTPKLDLLIIGVGSTQYKLPNDVVNFLRKKNINFETYTTDHAIAIFNFLNNDQRWVAACLLPPERGNTQDESNLQEFVEGKYKHILDISSMPIEDELEMKHLEETGQTLGPKRLQQYKLSELEADKIDPSKLISPLGSAQSFMAGDFKTVDCKKPVTEDVTETKTDQSIESAGENDPNKTTK